MDWLSCAIQRLVRPRGSSCADLESCAACEVRVVGSCESCVQCEMQPLVVSEDSRC